jgi:basic membrane protein A and related proteins
VRARKWTTLGMVAALAASLAVGATASSRASFTVSLIGDTGGFNDNGFNKNQLKALNDAAKKLGITAVPLLSHSASDYSPNINTAIRKGANLVIGAGYLLAPALKTYAPKFPKVNFAITDDSYKDLGGGKNTAGITYATQQGGCLVGILAAKMAKKLGTNAVGAVGGIKIPSVDSYIAGYFFCAKKVVPGIKTIVQYSNDFNAADKCAALAQNEIGQGAKIIFQVAGGCGLGALKAASDAGGYGIGVDADEYNDAKRILTSATKHTDTGVYQTIVAAKAGKFKGGTDVLFDLKNGGVGLGKVNPAVPKAWMALVNSYKAQIVSGKLKVPSTL